MDAFKAVVFEKLAKAVFEEREAARNCKLHGHDELSLQANHQALGIMTAVGALGYDSEEFNDYYRANRRRYRNDGNDPVIEVQACDVCKKHQPKSKFYGVDTTCEDCINKDIEEEKKRPKEAWESI